MNNEELYYLQDSRSYVGNDILFWAVDGKGYTTDLSKAHVYTKEEAISQNQARETDIPWPKQYMDTKTRPAVDMQYVKITDALEGTGIILKPKEVQKKTRNRCTECGSFVHQAFPYIECARCGTQA